MRIKYKSKIIKELIPLIIVIIISLLIIPVAGVTVNNNTARYLHEAHKVLQGEGSGMMSHDTLTARRPLFIIILVSGFKLWGKNVHSASLATRIFFALEIILIYLLGRIFYSKAVGFLSSGLVLTSWGVNFTARYIDADIVLPFFILLFILIYQIALTRSSRTWAVFAGLSLGLALMVKQPAWIFFGLPIGMVLLAPKEKRWEYGKICLWVIGAMVIPLILCAIYMILATDAFLSIVDVVRLQYQMTTKRLSGPGALAYWITLLTIGLPKTLFKYYQSFLLKVTPLSFLMIIGWFFVFIRGLISKKTSDLILTVLVICSLPFILHLAALEERFGQTTMVYMFLYIAFATFVVSCTSFLMSSAVKFNNKYKKLNFFNSADKKYPRLISILLIVLVGFFLIKAQLFDKYDPTWHEWTRGRYPLAVFSKQPFKVYGRFTTEQNQAAEWLKKNAAKNAKIIADGFTNEALDFFEVADYEIPVFHPMEGIQFPFYSLEKRDDNAHPLYFITSSKFDSGSQGYRIYIPIFEEDIVTVLKKEGPDYLALSGRGLFFSAYFDKAEWASLKFDNKHVRIYEIHLDRIEPVAFENVGVNETINKHLIWLKNYHPDEYSKLKDKIKLLGLTIDEVKNSPLRFPREQIY